jgi:hypothetical protein
MSILTRERALAPLPWTRTESDLAPAVKRIAAVRDGAPATFRLEAAKQA